jgi:hypothetical protein
MNLSSIQVKPGQVISGPYRRASYSVASHVTVEVAAAVVHGGGTLLVGTSLEGSGAGNVIAVYADCFDPRDVSIRDADGDVVDLTGYYLGANYRAFGFLKRVEPADYEWIEAAGGKAILDYEQLESVQVPCVAD